MCMHIEYIYIYIYVCRPLASNVQERNTDKEASTVAIHAHMD